MNTLRKKYIVVAALTGVLAVLALPQAGCDKKPSQAATNPDGKEKPVPVGTWEVGKNEFQRTVEIAAEILPGASIIMTSKIPGEVARVRVVEGDHVKKGQALVELDRTDYRLAMRQAAAQMSAAKAGLSAAEIGFGSISNKYERFAALHRKKAVSDNEFDDISSGKNMTQSKLMGARAQIQLAEVAVDMAKTNLSRTVIRAPFDGVVAQRMVDEGARLHAMPPSPVIMLADLDRIKVQGSVGQRDLPDIKRGAQVDIFVDSIGPEPIPATIEIVEPMVDPRTRTAKVRVLLPNPLDPKRPERRLHPGMSARMVIKLASRESPGVPDDAVLRTSAAEKRGFVYVLKDGKAFRREVTFGARAGDLLQILDGLAGGETIVRGGQELLSDGRPVTVVGAKEESR